MKVAAHLPYLAYGSNMHPAAMRAVCPSAKALGVARLDGRRLVFRGAISSMVDPNAHIDGVLWWVTDDDIRDLDAWERCPDLYVHEEVAVALRAPGPPVPAFIYVMRSTDTPEGLAGPGPAYLALVLEAARMWGIPEQDIVAAARLAGQAGEREPAAMPWADEYWAKLLRGST